LTPFLPVVLYLTTKKLGEIGSRFAKFGQTISARLDIAKARKTLIFRAF